MPLFVMHFLTIAPGKETTEIRNQLNDVSTFVTGSKRAPRSLTFERPGEPAGTVPIQGALLSPVLLDAQGSR